MNDDSAADDGFEPDLDVELLRRRRERVLVILVLAALVSATALGAYWVFRGNAPNPEVLTALARKAVTEYIDVPASLSFDEVLVQPQDSGRYLVTGKVEAVSIANEVAVYRFTCIMAPHTDGSWRTAEVKLERQP